MEKPSKQNIGNAGEYYLASILSAKNFTVTITLGRNEKYDLLAVNPKGKTIKLSVKTRFKKVKRFPIDKKCENLINDDIFYAFIILNEFKQEPDYWIVPSKIVAKIIKISHRSWLQQLNKKGKKHKESNIRNFWIVNKRHYPKNWENQLKKYYKNIEMLMRI
ncbi:MAG: hypothetical protein QXJ06_05120 [Candidatus Aenigmatarchaeota archaeon]